MPSMTKEYQKKWYEKNKEKHLNYCKEKIDCECGKEISRNSATVHKKSEYHKKRLEKINEDKKQLRQQIINEIINVNKVGKDLNRELLQDLLLPQIIIENKNI